MRWTLCVAQLGAQGFIRLVVLVIAVEIAEQFTELLEGLLIHAAAILGNAVAGAFAQLLQRPAGFGYADDRHVERALLHHTL